MLYIWCPDIYGFDIYGVRTSIDQSWIVHLCLLLWSRLPVKHERNIPRLHFDQWTIFVIRFTDFQQNHLNPEQPATHLDLTNVRIDIYFWNIFFIKAGLGYGLNWAHQNSRKGKFKISWCFYIIFLGHYWQHLRYLSDVHTVNSILWHQLVVVL